MNKTVKQFLDRIPPWVAVLLVIVFIAAMYLYNASREKKETFIPMLSYGRGVGRLDFKGCKNDEERQGLMCYKPCDNDFTGVGPICWYKHPRVYARGLKRIDTKKCNANEDRELLNCYDKCLDNYKGVGAFCWKI